MAVSPASPDGALKSELSARLSARLVADLPGLIAVEPAAVDAALDVVTELLGETLGLARLVLDGDAYWARIVKGVMRADRVARDRAEAALKRTAAAAGAGRA